MRAAWMMVAGVVGCAEVPDAPPELLELAAVGRARFSDACPDLVLSARGLLDERAIVLDIDGVVTDALVSGPLSVVRTLPAHDLGVTAVTGTALSAWLCDDSALTFGPPSDFAIDRTFGAVSGEVEIWVEPAALPLPDPLYGSWGETAAVLRDVTFEESATGASFFVPSFFIPRTTIQLRP